MVDVIVIGVYRVEPTPESIQAAAKFHGFDWLLDPDGVYADEVPWGDLENLGLVELQLSGDFTSLDLLEIHQGDQAPYLEYYLDPLGLERLDEVEAVATDGRLVCFFLHFTDVTNPLEIGGTSIPLPDFSELPQRLKPYTHYVPVD